MVKCVRRFLGRIFLKYSQCPNFNVAVEDVVVRHKAFCVCTGSKITS